MNRRSGSNSRQTQELGNGIGLELVGKKTRGISPGPPDTNERGREPRTQSRGANEKGQNIGSGRNLARPPIVAFGGRIQPSLNATKQNATASTPKKPPISGGNKLGSANKTGSSFGMGRTNGIMPKPESLTRNGSNSKLPPTSSKRSPGSIPKSISSIPGTPKNIRSGSSNIQQIKPSSGPSIKLTTNDRPPIPGRSGSQAKIKPHQVPAQNEPKEKIGMFRDKPSDRLVKAGDPFSKGPKGNGSQLAVMYQNGQIPCHVDYQGTKLKLNWKGPGGAEEADFETMIVAFVDGLSETKHPLNFMAQQGIRDMLETSVNSR